MKVAKNTFQVKIDAHVSTKCNFKQCFFISLLLNLKVENKTENSWLHILGWKIQNIETKVKRNFYSN